MGMDVDWGGCLIGEGDDNAYGAHWLATDNTWLSYNIDPTRMTTLWKWLWVIQIPKNIILFR